MAGREGRLKERARKIAWAVCIVAGFCLLRDSGTAVAFQQAVFVKGDVGDFPANWKSRERAGKLVYTVREDAAGSFLRAESKSDSHTIGYPLSLEVGEYPFLRFSWRAVSLPPGGNEREKSTNDGALGIYVVFEGWSMPPRSIKYVWSTTLPVGTVAESPYSKKARIVVLRSGSGGVGEWIDERVNVLEDFRRLFGENEVPRVRGIGILTDSDNTASTSAGDYRSLRFSREEEEVASRAAP
jgi:hypothetical protein